MGAYEDIACVIHSTHLRLNVRRRPNSPSPLHRRILGVHRRRRPLHRVRHERYRRLGEQAVKALEGRGAALIANHGMVAVAPTTGKAMHITALVERSAKIIWGARQLGEIHHLPEKVDESFASVYEYLRTQA